MGEIQKVVDHMNPEEALDEIALVAKKLFLLAGLDARTRFISNPVKEEELEEIKRKLLTWG
jgi:hypothetical protein